MPVNTEAYFQIKNTCDAAGVTLVAVSKTKPAEDILELYALGQRDFGENYVQELVDKAALLPKDIRWHFIGHLQSNKVKYIAPFVHLIHGVDSEKLLREVNKQALKNSRKIACLLQVHIAQEETKFGFDAAELASLDPAEFPNIGFSGLMGMGSFTDNALQVRQEFRQLKELFDTTAHAMAAAPTHAPGHFNTLSMGMSGDYRMAIEEGSTMVRIGSLLFGARQKA